MPRHTKGRRPTPASRHATLASSDRSRAIVKMSSGPPVPADVRAHAIEQLAAAAAQSKVSNLLAEASLSFESIAMGVAERTEIKIVSDTKVRRAHSGDRIAVPLTSTFLRPSLALAGRRCKVRTGHESKEEMETATYTTNTTKDSSEIVLEAGNAFSYM